VIAGKRLGAEQIIIIGCHPDLIALAKEFGATDVVVGGGPAPVRAYSEQLLPDILEGRIELGRVFDRTVDLDGVPGYRTMADRESITVMVQP
jgi:threonine dehydrogenase-like Zn-dependent dehydrogenase